MSPRRYKLFSIPPNFSTDYLQNYHAIAPAACRVLPRVRPPTAASSIGVRATRPRLFASPSSQQSLIYQLQRYYLIILFRYYVISVY